MIELTSNPLGDNKSATSVAYFENPLLPGKKMFLCTGLNASLAVDSCKVMYQSANASKDLPDSLMRCRGCRIGAMHAGVIQPEASQLFGAHLCCRCNRTDMRLIGGTVCVSCKNREYECMKGRNAKGKAPAKHPALERRTVRYCAAGEVKALTRGATTSTDELVIELMRDSSARILIGRGSQKSLVSQRQAVLF